jgi:hypothetical protein
MQFEEHERQQAQLLYQQLNFYYRLMLFEALLEELEQQRVDIYFRSVFPDPETDLPKDQRTFC